MMDKKPIFRMPDPHNERDRFLTKHAPNPRTHSTPNAGLYISAESYHRGVTTVTVGSDVVFSFEDNDDKIRHVARIAS